jgi:hypothetical protein
MNKIDIVRHEDFEGVEAPTPRSRREAPKAIKIVLPVWGYGYVRQFLEYGLPTLLAPGNVPALAGSLPTQFVLLTSDDDKALIEENATFRRLAAICDTEVRPIDHLITDGNYSTTITLAYTEAVRATGEAMVDTCFFFLVSDYIMADGSLANALKRMLDGASAVTVGNFQVAHEDALAWLQDRLARDRHCLAIPPRELMRWALTNLHPATLANIVNIPFNHNSHTNRLFWRVDSNTILGKFYLMHMLCVRPEVADFIIGASCDYSFVPEMCPSGNVDALTDSDEYLVIEMQPRHHEARFLKPGPLNESALAKSLGEWTTVVHRENAKHTLIFHADDPPPDIATSIDAADSFVARVTRHLTQGPKPHRGHPYWHGAIAAFYDATGRRLDDDEWRYALGLPASSRDWLSSWLLYRAKYSLMGRPPHVLPWHPAWPDYQTALRELQPFFAEPRACLLLLSNEPTALSLALADGGERVHRLRCNPFLQKDPQRYVGLYGKFDFCLLELTEIDMRYGDRLVDRIVPLMKSGGRIIVFVLNRHIEDKAQEFTGSVMYHSSRFVRTGALPSELHFVPANAARWRARRGMFKLRRLIDKRPWLSPLAIVGGGFYLALSLIGNLDTLRRTRRVAPTGHTSSFVMRLTVDVPRTASQFAPTRPDQIKDHLAAPRDKTAPGGTPAKAAKHGGGELRGAVAAAMLGGTTDRIWHDEPRRVGIMLARYQFVATLFAGRANVAQIDGGDAFGARLVACEVPDVTVYGADPHLIDDIRERQDGRWPFKTELHDILAMPLPRMHEAVFSLDLFERIPPPEQHPALVHLAGSLAANGILVIGAPAREGQRRGGSAAGVSHGKSGRELKALLEHYFAQVLVFSMYNEVIEPGVSAAAHYSFAVCTGPKWEAGNLKRDRSPLFEICEWPRGNGFYVRVTHPNSEPHRVEGFATVAEAANWISEQASDWLRDERSTSY